MHGTLLRSTHSSSINWHDIQYHSEVELLLWAWVDPIEISYNKPGGGHDYLLINHAEFSSSKKEIVPSLQNRPLQYGLAVPVSAEYTRHRAEAPKQPRSHATGYPAFPSWPIFSPHVPQLQRQPEIASMYEQILSSLTRTQSSYGCDT